MKTAETACPLDCPDACSLEVKTDGDRLIAVDGSRRNPFTQGFICSKVRDFGAHVECEERLRHPGIRIGTKGEGRFRRATWEEALALIAERFSAIKAEFGGEALLPFCYGGSNGFLTQGATDARFFHRLGASNLLRTFCAAATGRAAMGLTGKMPGVALPDYEHSKMIVLWGVNPSASGIHLVPILKKARERGARIVVVDPRATPLAKSATLHLQIRPGTDLPVALSVIDWFRRNGKVDAAFLARHTTGSEALLARAEAFDMVRAARVADIPVKDLETFASLYAESSPAVIRCGWGPERSRHGGSATAAILALPAIAGKFGLRGGGYTMSNSGAWKTRMDRVARAVEPPTRSINMSLLGQALTGDLSPGIRGLFVYNANPVATAPAQNLVRKGLSREDLFTVVFEQVMTDTAAYADVILPATTFLEHDEISRGYGAFAMQSSSPVIPPVGEARPNYAVFADLCRRMGLEKPDDPVSPADLRAAFFQGLLDGARVQEDLRSGGIATPSSGAQPVQFLDNFPNTPDQRMHLCPQELDRECPGGLYHYETTETNGQFPLTLISPATNRTISSTFGQLWRSQVPVALSPEDAARRGIPDGAKVRVFNQQAEVLCFASIDPSLRPGVAVLPKGLWAKHTLNGQTANALAPDHVADLGGQACYNDAQVEISVLA